jgi:signal transduction histidine kinase
MGRRLIAGYTLLLVLVLIALEVPLGATLAGRDSQRMVADRLADAMWFGTLAEQALRTGDLVDLESELDRYHDLYDIGAGVVDADGREVTAFPRDLVLHSGPARRCSQTALAGQQVGDDTVIWPWTDGPLIIAVPVGGGGESFGAVVLVSPTGHLAADLTTTWIALGAGGLCVLAIGLFGARCFTRWTLRPVADLDTAVNELSAGKHGVRVPEHAGPVELRRLAGGFNRMVTVVSDTLERQRLFVSHASHQLRNPLTALRLRVEDLGDDLVTSQAREGHRLALEEAQRLGQMLDSLLAMARVDEGRSQLERVDPEAVAASRVIAWRPVADRRGVILRHETARRCENTADGGGVPFGDDQPEPIEVMTVSTALDQALDALIDNAVKFSDEGGEVVVRVERLRTGARENTAVVRGGRGARSEISGVAVHVIDNGPGLTEEQRGHALERFWRAPDTQNVSGKWPWPADRLGADRGVRGQDRSAAGHPQWSGRLRVASGGGSSRRQWLSAALAIDETSGFDVAVVPRGPGVERERFSSDGDPGIQPGAGGMSCRQFIATCQ